MEDMSGGEISVKRNSLARICCMDYYFGYGNELGMMMIDLEIPYPIELNAFHLQ